MIRASGLGASTGGGTKIAAAMRPALALPLPLALQPMIVPHSPLPPRVRKHPGTPPRHIVGQEESIWEMPEFPVHRALCEVVSSIVLPFPSQNEERLENSCLWLHPSCLVFGGKRTVLGDHAAFHKSVKKQGH